MIQERYGSARIALRHFNIYKFKANRPLYKHLKIFKIIFKIEN